MAQDGSRRFNWAGLPLIATVARLLCADVFISPSYSEPDYLRIPKGCFGQE